MKKDKAKEILIDFQKYRRSEPPYEGLGVKCKYSAAEIGRAIDMAISQL